jgi:hypothetical protein
VIAAVRKTPANGPVPRAPRLDALRSALAKLDPSSVPRAGTALQTAPCGLYTVTRRAQGEAVISVDAAKPG